MALVWLSDHSGNVLFSSAFLALCFREKSFEFGSLNLHLGIKCVFLLFQVFEGSHFSTELWTENLFCRTQRIFDLTFKPAYYHMCAPKGNQIYFLLDLYVLLNHAELHAWWQPLTSGQRDGGLGLFPKLPLLYMSSFWRVRMQAPLNDRNFIMCLYLLCVYFKEIFEEMRFIFVGCLERHQFLCSHWMGQLGKRSLMGFSRTSAPQNIVTLLCQQVLICSEFYIREKEWWTNFEETLFSLTLKLTCVLDIE